MNACRDVRLKLSAYVDGELATGERARVVSHLSECGECRGLEADLKHVDRYLAPESEPPLAPGATEALIGRLRLELGAAPRPGAVPLALVPAARAGWGWVRVLAVAAVVGLGVLIWGRSGRDEVASVQPPVRPSVEPQVPPAVIAARQQMSQLDARIAELETSVHSFTTTARAESSKCSQQIATRRFGEWK